MNPSPFLLAIPAAFDFTASTLMFVALTMTPASVYQMMRGAVTIITAVMSILILKKKLYRHHWTGLACIVLALAEVGVVAIHFDKPDPNVNGSITLGIILIIIAQFFAGALFIVEEYFIGDYYLDPLKVVGTEGMWGFLYFLIALPIMQAVKCSGTLCNYGYFENSSYAFY
jgi:drug/metabolite transporter (DMT)-like permease